MSEMDNTNPYASPTANVARDGDPLSGGTLIEGGRSVDAGRGAAWIGEGFSLFMKAPVMWVVNILILAVIWIVCIFIPLIGPLALNLLIPVFIAGLLLGCRALDAGEPLEVNHLFAGFKANVGQLVLVGVLYLVGALIIGAICMVLMLLIGGFGAFTALASGHATAGAGMGLLLGFMLIGLLALALSIPLVMAVWFAPALVLFHEVEPINAMKQSFAACLKNIIPFLIWGLIAFVLSIIAAIPFGLGYLVLMPVTIGALYRSYREIFVA